MGQDVLVKRGEEPGIADEGRGVGYRGGEMRLCQRVCGAAGLGGQRLARAGNVDIDGAGVGGEEVAVALVVGAEGDELKLEPPEGEAGQVEEADEPGRDEGADGAVDELALVELVAKVEDGVIEYSLV